jgi:hypothetical protein
MNKYKKGTVGWLIEKLEKFPKDMTVLSGDRDGWWYALREVSVKGINEEGIEVDDDEDVKDAESCVCIGVH